MTPGGSAPGSRGSHYERETVERFRSNGWGCIRVPSSGSSTKRDLPDILAGRPRFQEWTGEDGDLHVTELSQLLAIELKSGKASTLYLQSAETDALEAFARRWGARPFLAARSTQQGVGTETYLVPPERARGPTDGGRYGLPVADIEERAAWIVTDEEVRRVD